MMYGCVHTEIMEWRIVKNVMLVQRMAPYLYRAGTTQMTRAQCCTLLSLTFYCSLKSYSRSKAAERTQRQLALASIVQVYLAQLAHGFFAGENSLSEIVQDERRKA
jgi:hypothetical protein